MDSKILKNEIPKSSKKEFENNLKEIKFIKNFTNDSYSELWLNDTFIVFKSINDIFFLLYVKKIIQLSLMI